MNCEYHLSLANLKTHIEKLSRGSSTLLGQVLRTKQTLEDWGEKSLSVHGDAWPIDWLLPEFQRRRFGDFSVRPLGEAIHQIIELLE